VIVVIDATGIGAGVCDQLVEHQTNGLIAETVEIREVHFGGKDPYAESPTKVTARYGNPRKTEQLTECVNLKARIFVMLADDLKTDLSILDHDVYSEELPNILYKFDSKGRYQMESKDEYKKRTGQPSPDSADSLALANFGRHGTNNVGHFGDEFTGGGGSVAGPSSTIAGEIIGQRW